MLENLEVGSFEFFMNDTTSQDDESDPSFEDENDRIKALLETFMNNQEIASEIGKQCDTNWILLAKPQGNWKKILYILTTCNISFFY